MSVVSPVCYESVSWCPPRMIHPPKHSNGHLHNVMRILDQSHSTICIQYTFQATESWVNAWLMISRTDSKKMILTWNLQTWVSSGKESNNMGQMKVMWVAWLQHTERGKSFSASIVHGGNLPGYLWGLQRSHRVLENLHLLLPVVDLLFVGDP